MSNVEIRSSIHRLTQVLATLAVRGTTVQVNPNTNITASRIRDFTRMNPPTLYGIKVDEDPQEFIDEVFQVLVSMGVSSQEKVELAYYQLKDVSQVWDLKKVRIEERNSSNNRFEVQDKPRFKRWFSNQEPPNAPRFNKSKVYTPNPQEGKGGGSYVEKPLCSKCGRKHDGKCLVGTGNFYGCGKSGHMKRDGPMMKTQGRESSQAQASAPNLDAPKKNRFYALQSLSDQRAHRTWSPVC
ncbi:uncharacterized protein LOC107030124 [Solanum pennellii]|uniref:Uncharacterized protein LOC107030124 n=1 Tax=Solanum pennellii TaxID=28526 RepID=A0ABM1HKZ3_SOLPN|nr:uncharacterized protein LOC107030124 [Solanum pennellii]